MITFAAFFSEGPDSTDIPENAESQKIAADGYIPKIINSRSGRGGCWVTYCCRLRMASERRR